MTNAPDDIPQPLTSADIAPLAELILAGLPEAERQRAALDVGIPTDHPGDLEVLVSEGAVAAVLATLTRNGYPNKSRRISGFLSDVHSVSILVGPRHNVVGDACVRCSRERIALVDRCTPTRQS